MQIDQVIALLSAISDDLAMVTEVMPEGDLRIRWVNDALCAASDYELDALVGQSPEIFAGINPDKDVQGWLADAREARRKFRGTMPYHRRDGTYFWGDLTLSPFLNAEGECLFWVSIIRDITADMELREAFTDAKQEAVTAQERLWSAIEALPHPFILFNAQDRLVMHNDRCREAFEEDEDILEPGVSFAEMLWRQVKRGHHKEAIGREDEWVAERLSRFSNPAGPFEVQTTDNKFFRVHEVKSATGDTVSLRIDVTEIKRQQQAVERHARALSIAMERAQIAAHTDTLTGLANRRGLDVYLRQVAETGSDAALPVAFLHIDLDRFKQINDTLGHAAGDLVLREVARILRQAVRPMDHVARVGGDEFAIVVQADDAFHVAREIADRVIEACRQPVWYDERPCHYGASIGIAVAGVGEAIDNLMEDADIALYEAKENGRNRAAFYAPSLRKAAEKGKHVEDDLRLALERGQVEIWYQPQLEPSGGALAGVEALARWNHPKLGCLSPQDFMPTATDLGLADEIDAYVFRTGLEQARQFSYLGEAIPSLTIGVCSLRLVGSRIAECLSESSSRPYRLTINLGGFVVGPDIDERTLWAIDAVRDASNGVDVQFDDFGSSEVSLRTLLQYKPDRMRIDLETLVPKDHPVDGVGDLIRSIGDMSMALGIGLTAKGVNAGEHPPFLYSAGCVAMQSDQLVPAMPAPVLKDWLQQHRAELQSRRA